jgi:response regulator RpfG family c-di-GMP phosphodiesterase
MSKYKILIVDDNKNNLVSLHALLEEYFNDIQIFEATSGMKALGVLLKNEVDLIILDIQMSHMDGFETAKFILSRPKTRHIPIVFLTAAYKSEEFKKKGLEMGATDYLTKPINTEQLVGKIKGYLHLIDKERDNQLYREKIEKQAREEASQASEDTKKMLKKDLINELNISLNTILSYGEILSADVIDLGVSNDCLPAIKKITAESQHLLEILRKEPQTGS